jgi:type I restriction enzyme, R subunit
MLKSLREALAQYALGDDGRGGEEIVAPIEERVQALIEAIEATEAHLRGLGFDPATLLGTKGFARIKGLADAVVFERRGQAALRNHGAAGLCPVQGAAR